jgi:hypothetical protein
MICTRAFQGQAGDRFGLRVVNMDNASSCIADVVAGDSNGSHPVGRFGLDKLRSGQAFWELESNTTYIIVMQVQSEVPGDNVLVEVEIPMGSGVVSDCSRLSSGMIGNWRVDVF